LAQSNGARQRLARVSLILANKSARRATATSDSADALTRSILAKAFRGELVPTEAALARAEGRDYESAEALLARIRPKPPVLVKRRRRDTRRASARP